MVTLEKLQKLAGTREGEVIVKVLHRHWFDLASHLFGIVFLAVTLFIGFFLFSGLFPTIFENENSKIIVFIENTFFLVLWIYIFLIWIDIWFDVWIITNKRIINIEQKGLFIRHISEISFSKVQDVTSEVEGLLQSILNYGEVYVQSAGETPRFLFRNIPDPVAVKDLVMKLSQGAKEDDLEDAVDILKDMERKNA